MRVFHGVRGFGFGFLVLAKVRRFLKWFDLRADVNCQMPTRVGGGWERFLTMLCDYR
jgi:hypothetical protein